MSQTLLIVTVTISLLAISVLYYRKVHQQKIIDKQEIKYNENDQVEFNRELTMVERREIFLMSRHNTIKVFLNLVLIKL